MTVRLRERIEESERLQRGQEAETQGLYAAQTFTHALRYSADPHMQARFELGFREGKAILEIDP